MYPLKLSAWTSAVSPWKRLSRSSSHVNARALLGRLEMFYLKKKMSYLHHGTPSAHVVRCWNWIYEASPLENQEEKPPSRPHSWINGSVDGLACLVAIVSCRNSQFISESTRPASASRRAAARLHAGSRDRPAATALPRAFTHHVGQSNGGGLSLLILVAILPHRLKAALHAG